MDEYELLRFFLFFCFLVFFIDLDLLCGDCLLYFGDNDFFLCFEDDIFLEYFVFIELFDLFFDLFFDFECLVECCFEDFVFFLWFLFELIDLFLDLFLDDFDVVFFFFK